MHWWSRRGSQWAERKSLDGADSLRVASTSHWGLPQLAGSHQGPAVHCYPGLEHSQKSPAGQDSFWMGCSPEVQVGWGTGPDKTDMLSSREPFSEGWLTGPCRTAKCWQFLWTSLRLEKLTLCGGCSDHWDKTSPSNPDFRPPTLPLHLSVSTSHTATYGWYKIILTEPAIIEIKGDNISSLSAKGPRWSSTRAHTTMALFSLIVHRHPLSVPFSLLHPPYFLSQRQP